MGLRGTPPFFFKIFFEFYFLCVYPPPPGSRVRAVGTHPTGMHSCIDGYYHTATCASSQNVLTLCKNPSLSQTSLNLLKNQNVGWICLIH